MTRALRFGALAAAAALLGAACGGGGDGGDGSGGGGSRSKTTTTVVQNRFHPQLFIPVLTQFGTSLGPRFEFDRDSVALIDMSVGELEFPDEATRQRYTFGLENGILGFASAEYVTSSGEEVWGLTIEVFRTRADARRMFEEFGSVEDEVQITDAELVDSFQGDFSSDRPGVVSVDTYRDEDGRRTFGMRASALDENVLYHVVAIVDASDEFPNARRGVRDALRSVLGLYGQTYREAVADETIDDSPPSEGDGDDEAPATIPGEDL